MTSSFIEADACKCCECTYSYRAHGGAIQVAEACQRLYHSMVQPNGVGPQLLNPADIDNAITVCYSMRVGSAPMIVLAVSHKILLSVFRCNTFDSSTSRAS